MIKYIVVILCFSQILSQIKWGANYEERNNKHYLEISFDIDSGYHIYGLKRNQPEGPFRTEIRLRPNQNYSVLKYPAGKTHYDDAFEQNVIWYKGKDSFIIEIYRPITENDTILMSYQLCTESFCLNPKTDKVQIKNAPIDLASIDESEYDSFKKKSLGDFLLLAISMGFLALMTPCVFPMIPITVSYFTKFSENTKSGAFKFSLVYGLGIVIIFTSLGFIASQLLGASGINNLASNPVLNIGIGILFLVFALSLFGLFDIRLPSSWINKVNAAGLKPGYLGILLSGIAFAMVSFTCTVQFFGLLLVAVADGDWFYPLLGMLGFSAAFASPFVILALFPQWISQMPRSGSWMEKTKIVMGFVEIIAAFKFFSQADLVWNLEILTRPLILIIWFVLCIVIGFYLLGMIRLSKNDESDKIGIIRLFFALFFLVSGSYLASGINGTPLQGDLDSYLPPAEYGRPAGSLTLNSGTRIKKETFIKENWIEDFAMGKKIAFEKNKPIFLEFTGKTCTNCRWMEKNIFVEKNVQKAFESFVLVKLWTDYGEEKEFNQQLQVEKFNTVSLPFYAILSPEGEILKTFAGMTREVEEFKDFLTLNENKSKAISHP